MTGASEHIRLEGLVSAEAGLAQDVYYEGVTDVIPVDEDMRIRVETQHLDPGAATEWTIDHGAGFTLVTHGSAGIEYRDRPEVEVVSAGTVHHERWGQPRRIVNTSASQPFGCFRVRFTPAHLPTEVVLDGPAAPGSTSAPGASAPSGRPPHSRSPAADLLVGGNDDSPVRRKVHLDRVYPHLPKVPRLQIRIAAAEMAPGGQMPWHLHNGGGLFLVLRGQCRIDVRGTDEPERYQAGDVLFEPLGVVHRGVNTSETDSYFGIGMKYCAPGLAHDVLESPAS